MPNYDYKCRRCSYTFEKFQPMTAKPLRKCPKCGGRVERLIGPGAGFIFKGSGFYATDYRKPERKSRKEEPTDKKPPDQCKSCPNSDCDMRNKN